MVKRRTENVLFYSALLWLLLPHEASAYLDPATGSYVIQIVVGAILGVAFAVRSYWNLFKVKISSLFNKAQS